MSPVIGSCATMVAPSPRCRGIFVRSMVRSIMDAGSTTHPDVRHPISPGAMGKTTYLLARMDRRKAGIALVVAAVLGAVAFLWMRRGGDEGGGASGGKVTAAAGARAGRMSKRVDV